MSGSARRVVWLVVALVVGVVTLFTGRYPRPLYDFILGMDR